MSRVRWMNLMVLGLLLVAIVAVACASEEEVPTPTATPMATGTPQTTATPAVTPTRTLQPTAVPTKAPTTTATPEPVERPRPVAGDPTPAPLSGDLRVVPPIAREVAIARPEAALSAKALLDTVPLKGVLAMPLSLDPSQQFGKAGGLTVLASGSVTVDADEAYVVVIPEPFYGRGRGPEPIPSEDRAQVIANLAALGIEEDKIDFESGIPYQPVSIAVEVEVKELPGAGERILDAVEAVLRRSQRSGVRFSLSEANCDRALALARQEAVPQAGKNAQALAQALGVRQGDVIEGIEFLLSNFGYAPVISGCGGSEQFSPYDVSLVPFDSEPKIEISILLQITYAIGFEEARGITVSASGSTVVDADEVYVVLVPEPRYGPAGPEPISARDRADVIANLAAMGIVEADIEFGSGRVYEPDVISVEVDMNDLPEIGDRILKGVEDVLRRTEISGVRFSLSEANCDQAQGLARQDAVPQADKSARALAEALGVGLGVISGAVEYPANNFGGFPLGTGCGDEQPLSPYEIPLMPFDADPKIEIVTQLQITYAIE